MRRAPTVLLTGVRGQLGWELHRALLCLGCVVACDRGDLDLAEAAAIRRQIREVGPDLVVNSAAFTAVDQAESEREQAATVNATAPGVMAEECARIGAALVHFSTDYVFDGKRDRPYLESDPPNPLNAYGASKLEGEGFVASSAAAHIILRTSWVYGIRGQNFLRTVQRLSNQQDRLSIVDDQVGAPTWSRCIADATAALLAGAGGDFVGYLRERGGLYHLSCAGQASWCEFARAIIARLPAPEQRATTVDAIASAQYPTPAVRPRYSVLDNSRLHDTFALALPQWEIALDLVLGRPR